MCSMDYYFLMFDQFETLDLFGPVEIFARTPGASLHYVSMNGGMVTSAQGTTIVTSKAETLPAESVLLVPGGQGTRRLVTDRLFLARLRELCGSVEYILSVCTGSALLAAAGILQGRKATSNKIAFDWVTAAGDAEWIKKARWVRDGNIYTSSGVSAGIDMALGFVADHYGMEAAEANARKTEYLWNRNAGDDPFA